MPSFIKTLARIVFLRLIAVIVISATAYAIVTVSLLLKEGLLKALIKGNIYIVGSYREVFYAASFFHAVILYHTVIFPFFYNYSKSFRDKEAPLFPTRFSGHPLSMIFFTGIIIYAFVNYFFAFNAYVVVTTEGLVMNKFYHFKKKLYPYKNLTKIEIIRKRSRPGETYYLVYGNDGLRWYLERNLNEEKRKEVAEYVSKQSGIPITKK